MRFIHTSVMGIELEINETPPTSSAKGQIREKWGAAVEGGGLTGYLALPEVLIRSQKRLQLTSTEMMVLINILTHWWRVDAKPFPGNYTIAKRMGVSRRTVQRAVKSMVNKGLISTAPMIHTEDDQTADIDWLDDENEEEDEDEMAEKALETPYSTVRLIDLSGLVARLNECALELREYNARTEAIKEDY